MSWKFETAEDEMNFVCMVAFTISLVGGVIFGLVHLVLFLT